MKTGTVKTLGAAALGVAFVGAAAGAASAAPSTTDMGLPQVPNLPATSLPVNQVAQAVPLDSLAGNLPKTGSVVPGAQNTPVAVNTLLGGLPLGKLPIGQLPIGQLPLQGLPIGG
ncbi:MULTISPECIES: ATP-binding protein [unclassified Streptomyces]|uniref:ATP-binding protein n=1 Tax=unclassified Streptomyces TaxID=2593676 RepID=UPI00382A6C55